VYISSPSEGDSEDSDSDDHQDNVVDGDDNAIARDLDQYGSQLPRQEDHSSNSEDGDGDEAVEGQGAEEVIVSEEVGGVEEVNDTKRDQEEREALEIQNFWTFVPRPSSQTAEENIQEPQLVPPPSSQTVEENREHPQGVPASTS